MWVSVCVCLKMVPRDFVDSAGNPWDTHLFWKLQCQREYKGNYTHQYIYIYIYIYIHIYMLCVHIHTAHIYTHIYINLCIYVGIDIYHMFIHHVWAFSPHCPCTTLQARRRNAGATFLLIVLCGIAGGRGTTQLEDFLLGTPGEPLGKTILKETWKV